MPLIIVVVIFGGIWGYNEYQQYSLRNKNLTTLKVSSNYPDLQDHGILFDIAENQGYLRKEGIQVEKVNSKNNTETLLSGSSDVAIFPVSGIVDSFYNGSNFKWLATTAKYSSNQYAVSRFPKDKLSEVKKIGVMAMGNGEQQVWPLILKEHGHQSVDKLKFVASPEINAKLALLDKGDLDLTFVVSYEMVRKLRDTGKYTIFEPSDFFSGEVEMPRGLVTTEKTLNEKHDALKGLVKATYKTISYIKTHKEEFVRLAQENYKMSKEDAELMYGDVMLSRENLQFVPEKSQIQSSADFVIANNKPKFPNRDLNELFYKQFAEQITK
jgi:ABC-type nitrate/sulfonate/bicarbonate transport system substrate-binding protein